MKQLNIPYRNGIVATHVSAGSAGPPVFMCHGNSSAGSTFQSLMEGPIGNARRLISITFPGHGASTAARVPNDAYTIPALADPVRAVIAHFRSAEYLLCGHSLGGHVLLEALSGFDGALGLLLISAPPISPALLGQVFRPDPVDGALFLGSLSEARVAALMDCLALRSRAPATARAALAASIAATDPEFRPALGRSIATGTFADERALLSKASMPIALCGGELDPFIDARFYASLAGATLWRGQPLVFAGAGHSPHLEAPEQFERWFDDYICDRVRSNSSAVAAAQVCD